jgi:8-oxo-dGTP pyrophosphatase MutT (NUDIX family)
MNALDLLRVALERRPSDHAGAAGPARASVCVVVAGPEDDLRICLVRRARWESDPWSEHIALPGGGREGAEVPSATALRELREEVGLTLPPDAELTPLPPLHVYLAGQERQLVIDPFACFVGAVPPPLRCSPEIDQAFWVPIATLWAIENATSIVLHDNDTLVYPAIRIPQGLVFGITLRVLTLLSDRLGVPLPALEEIPLLRRRTEDRW